MCTVVTDYRHHLFGRTMDFPPRTPWKLTYLPQNYKWSPAGQTVSIVNQYAILGGMRLVDDHFLIGDGINTTGLICAELFFPVAADYSPRVSTNTLGLTPQDFIGWVLGQHATVQEVVADLQTISVIEQPWYDHQLYPFHWVLMDQTGSYVIEPLEGRLCLVSNPSEVVTNTPALEDQLRILNQTVGYHGSSFTPETVSAIQKHDYQLPTGGNSSQRFMRAAIWRWGNRPHTELALQNFLQTVTVPKTPEHAHNYTHYQLVLNQEEREYGFYDCHTKQVIKKRLGNLVTGSQVQRFG